MKNENEIKLMDAFQFVRKTFFPRWDRNYQWRIYLDSDLPSLGRCNVQGKEMFLRGLQKDEDELHFLIIHEICHVAAKGALGHNKNWYSRMEKAAEKAKDLGYEKLAEKIYADVALYRDSEPESRSCEPVYGRICDIVIDTKASLSFEEVLQSMASEMGLYPEDVLRDCKKIKKVYEEEVREYRKVIKQRERLQALLSE